MLSTPKRKTSSGLSIRNLKTHYFTRQGVVKAVDGVNLDVEENEIVGVVGESGCGKSSIALSIMRLIPKPGRIIEGEVIFKGRNLLQLNEEEMRSVRGSDIAMVFQDPMTYLNPVLTIGDQIAETLTVHQHLDSKEVRSRVIRALELVSIPSPSKLIQYYPHQLSGGMRQRVLISIALACDPALLIADEPTTSLDVTTQAQILELKKQLRSKLGLSIIIITHNLGIVADMCDVIAVMYAGNIVEKGTVEMIFDRPAHPYTIGLIDSVLTIAKVKKRLTTIEGMVPDLINPPQGCRFHPRCVKAKEVCRKEAPREIESERNHLVCCWLYE